MVEPIQRSIDGHVQLYRLFDDKTIVVTDEMLGALGYAINSGYLGGSLRLELFATKLLEHETFQFIKNDFRQQLSILRDSPTVLQVDMREIRSFLDDYGYHYNKWDVVAPFFLEDPLYPRQFYAFLKGIVLGCLSEDMLKQFLETNLITFVLPSYQISNSIENLMNIHGVSYELVEENVYKLLTTGSLNRWLMNQKAGFTYV